MEYLIIICNSFFNENLNKLSLNMNSLYQLSIFLVKLINNAICIYSI